MIRQYSPQFRSRVYCYPPIKEMTIRNEIILYLFLSPLFSERRRGTKKVETIQLQSKIKRDPFILSFLYSSKSNWCHHSWTNVMLILFRNQNKRMGWNIYWYFYKEYFIEGLIKLLLNTEKLKLLKDEINSEILFFLSF